MTQQSKAKKQEKTKKQINERAQFYFQYDFCCYRGQSMCDREKLIPLVEKRPAIYNCKIKEHNDKKLIENLWLEIANEMKCTVDDCKHRWATLRNSFARCVREEAKVSAGSAVKRRKVWYYAESMSFLREHMSPHRYAEFPTTDSHHTTDSNSGNESALSQFFEPYSAFLEEKPKLPNIDNVNCTTSTSKTISPPPPPANLDYLRPYPILNEQDDEVMAFLKGLAPDIRKLSEKYMRVFKRNMFENLFNLLDQQDKEDEENPQCADVAHSCQTITDSLDEQN